MVRFEMKKERGEIFEVFVHDDSDDATAEGSSVKLYSAEAVSHTIQGTIRLVHNAQAPTELEALEKLNAEMKGRVHSSVLKARGELKAEL